MNVDANMETPDVTLAFPLKILRCMERASLEVDVHLDFTPWFLVIPASYVYTLQVEAIRQRPINNLAGHIRLEGEQLEISSHWQDLVQIPHPIPACIYSDRAPRVKLGIPEKIRRGSRLSLLILNTGGMTLPVNAVLLGKR